MKSIKRSLNDRFYNRGYRAGIGEVKGNVPRCFRYWPRRLALRLA